MKFRSTRDNTTISTFQEALFHGLAPDGGLYIPTALTPLSPALLSTIPHSTLHELGETLMHHFLPELAAADLTAIIQTTLNFPIPLVPLADNLYLLEVFHGPTLAFKDVGARFMATMLNYYLSQQKRQLRILVATSGDTGSAIAHAFHGIPDVDVYILYPSRKVTLLQEKQMTTLGDNIHALEVTGTFDDCQRMVKTALLDNEIQAKCAASTANSINIARLLPQVIYHGFGLVQLLQQGINKAPVITVPSGNFGNLTAAVYAAKIGLTIQHFIAATNSNAIVPHYLETGIFQPEPSRQTYSNAMDVGNPSNFERLLAVYDGDYLQIQSAITGIAISDADTVNEIRETYDSTGYILDPHTAVGVASAKRSGYLKTGPVIVAATAHPAKFPDVIQRALQQDIPVPDRLRVALDKPKQATLISADYEAFKKHLLR